MTPEELYNKFQEYKEKHDNGDYYRKIPRLIQNGRAAGKIVEIKKRVPLSIERFCLYAGIQKYGIRNQLGKLSKFGIGFFDMIDGLEQETRKFYDIANRILLEIESDLIEGIAIGEYEKSAYMDFEGGKQYKRIKRASQERLELRQVKRELDLFDVLSEDKKNVLQVEIVDNSVPNA